MFMKAHSKVSQFDMSITGTPLQEIRATLAVTGLAPRAPDWAAGGGALPTALPAFQRGFARADAAANVPANNFAGVLAHLFGGHNAGLPVAALTHWLDSGARTPGYWLRADPVHLEPRGGALVMLPATELTHSDAAGLLADLNRALPELAIEAPVPGRWYVRLAGAPAVDFTDIETVAGRNIDDYLPRGAHAGNWRRYLNEIQMVLHARATAAGNDGLASASARPVNSVWFWGGGSLPAAVPTAAQAWTQLWSNELLSTGLARWAQVPRAALPADANEWRRQVTEPGAHLLVLNATALHPEWSHAIETFDRTWLTPLLTAVRRGEIAELRLLGDHGLYPQQSHPWRQWSWTARHLKRWWRPRQDIATCLRQLAGHRP